MLKKSFVVLALFIVFSIAASAAEIVKTIEIKTSAICEMCQERIEKAVKELDGIKSANLTVDTKIIKVDYDESKVKPEDIKEKISKTGYDADDVRKDKKAFKKLPKCCQGK
jgi:copper chaperone CopZ